MTRADLARLTGAAFMPMSAACHAVAVDFDDFDVDCG